MEVAVIFEPVNDLYAAGVRKSAGPMIIDKDLRVEELHESMCLAFGLDKGAVKLAVYSKYSRTEDDQSYEGSSNPPSPKDYLELPGERPYLPRPHTNSGPFRTLQQFLRLFNAESGTSSCSRCMRL